MAAGASRAVVNAEELDAGRGWDLVIDCTGVVAAIEDGLGRVRRGGTFLQFGVANETALASWSPFQIYNNEITIAGSMAVLHSFERAAELFAAGVLDAGSIISDRIPLDEYPDALDRFRARARNQDPGPARRCDFSEEVAVISRRCPAGGPC